MSMISIASGAALTFIANRFARRSRGGEKRMSLENGGNDLCGKMDYIRKYRNKNINTKYIII